MPSWKCLLAEPREYHDHPNRYLVSLIGKFDTHTYQSHWHTSL